MTDQIIRIRPSAEVEAPREPLPRVSEFDGYNLGRALYAIGAAAHHGLDPRRRAPLEFDVSDHLADRLTGERRGLVIPDGALGAGHRAPPMDSTLGAYQVQQADLGLAQALQARSIMTLAGMQVLEGLSGVVTFAAGEDVTVTGVAEDGTLPDFEVPIRALKLEPFSYGVHVPVTRQLRLQSNPALEAFLTEAFLAGFADHLDRVAIEGDANTGAVGAYGVALPISVGGPGQPNAWGDVVAVLGAAAQLGGNAGFLSWILGADAFEAVMDQGTSPADAWIQAHGNASSTMVTVPVFMRAKLATPDLFMAGRMRYMVAGLFGPMQVEANLDASAPAKGRTLYSAWQEFDVEALQIAFTRPVP